MATIPHFSPLNASSISLTSLRICRNRISTPFVTHGGSRKALSTSSRKNAWKRERVVILGSGWAGYALARALDPKKYERVLISPRSYFVFTPLLAGTAVGTLEFRTILESVRRIGLDNFHQGWADDVDFARKTVRVEANTSDETSSRTHLRPVKPSALSEGKKKGAMFDVSYDKLIVAVGSYSQTFGIEGVREYANFLRDVGDARSIRLKILQCFEKAALPTATDEERKKLLHFAIVGGGPTGIEFAAELHDLLHEDLKKIYPELMRFVAITVYDVAPKVLPMFDEKLGQYAMDTFKREGIVVKTQHHLERVRPDEECDGAYKLKIKEYGDEELGAGIVVWSTGLMQNPFIQKITHKQFKLPGPGTQDTGEVGLAIDEKTGGIITNEHLRVKLSSQQDPLPDVFAIGDCAVLEHEVLPATAQVASQKAQHLAKRLNKHDVDGKPFKFRNLGTMAYIGNWRALYEGGGNELTGMIAWILWRTAYLTKSVSVRNKIMVPVYWFITWLFGRDISKF